jgi:hypothetical protein
VLGIVGSAISLIPIIGQVAIFFGLIGIGLGLPALFRPQRGMAIAGVILSVLALVLGFSIANMYASAVSEAFGARDVTSADGAAKTTFNVGETADAEGLRVTLTNPHHVKDSGQNYLCSDVAYDNQSTEQRSFNLLSWEVQGGDNVITSSFPRFGGDKTLGSGQLDVGGKVAGEVCWKTPQAGEIKMIWTEGLGSSTKATWVARL